MDKKTILTILITMMVTGGIFGVAQAVRILNPIAVEVDSDAVDRIVRDGETQDEAVNRIVTEQSNEVLYRQCVLECGQQYRAVPTSTTTTMIEVTLPTRTIVGPTTTLFGGGVIEEGL